MKWKKTGCIDQHQTRTCALTSPSHSACYVPTKRNHQGIHRSKFVPQIPHPAFKNEINLETANALIVGPMPLAVEVPDVLQAVHVPHARDKYDTNQCQYVVPAGFRHESVLVNILPPTTAVVVRKSDRTAMRMYVCM